MLMTKETWTAKRVLDWIEEYLRNHGDANPRTSAQWLVTEALHCNRMALLLDPERPLSGEERATLRDYTRRRAKGEPLQYITGEAPFRHIAVKVRHGVLIPRPETEVLVSEALALLPPAARPLAGEEALMAKRFKALVDEQGMDAVLDALRESFNEEEVSAIVASLDCEEAQPLLVADICTGSGCIACAVASERPDTRVIATDISPEAVALATENVSALGLGERIEVLEGNLGSALDETLLGTFDLIISNPPYIPTALLAEIPHEVSLHEPALALDGGQDGLDIFRELLPFCAQALRPGGAFAMELHETCLDQAEAEATTAGFEGARIAKDLAGKPRVLVARKPL